MFNKEWKEQNFFTDVGSIAVCLICGDTDSVFMVFSLNCLLTSKHEGYCASLSSDARTRVIKQVMMNFKKQ
jgi:hypothetical protein